MKQTLQIGGRECLLYSEGEKPQVLLIQTLGAHERGSIDSEVEMIREMAVADFKSATHESGISNPLQHPLPIVLGGYSLGGLFSLWLGSESDCFTAIAVMSPSVWITGWLDYARQHPVKAHYVYLSLGDREEHTRNKAIAQVGNNIRWEHEHLKHTLGFDHTMLEWNTGNHFVDGARRTAKGFAWCINKIVNRK